MSLKTRIIGKAQRAVDKVRPRVMPDARFFLLRRNGQTQRLTGTEVTSGVFVRWSTSREQMQFMVASDDSGLIDEFAQTSFIGYGVPSASNLIDVFSVSAEQHDRIPPTGTSPFWKLFGTRKPEMRFEVTD